MFKCPYCLDECELFDEYHKDCMLNRIGPNLEDCYKSYLDTDTPEACFVEFDWERQLHLS